MSSALIVTKDKKQTHKSLIDKPEFTIGRSVKCDLVLDDENISRQNTTVRRNSKGKYVIADCGSRNGTFYRGKPIAGEQVLKAGDKFIIGPFELTLISEDGDDFDDDATRAANARGGKGMPQQAKASGAASHLAVQLVAENGPLKGNRFKNWGDKLSVGRHIENDVVLPDDATSNFHAAIEFGADGYVIEDLGSANGTFVGGTRVNKQVLRAKEEVRIGTTRFTYTCVDMAKAKRRRTVMLSTFVVFMLLLISLKTYMWLNPPQYVAMMQQVEAMVKEGRCEEALPRLDAVLKLKANHARARQLKASCSEEVHLVKLQDDVTRRTGNEDFQGALDICREALRIRPGHPWYAQRESILKEVIEAKEAVNNRNWRAAIVILEKAENLFSNSDEIRMLLSKARIEEENQRRLLEARSLSEQGELQSLVDATRLLETISVDSGYAEEVQAFLPEVRAKHQFETAVANAQNAYQQGRLSEAEQQVNVGLKLNEDDRRLSLLKSKILRIKEPFAQVNGVRAADLSGDIPLMTRLVAACDEILSVEREAQNGIHQMAAKLRNDLSQQMGGLASDKMSLGTQLQAQGNWKGAALAYGQALSANPDFAPARAGLNEVSEIVSRQVKTLYQEAVIQIDLGEKEAARSKLLQVLEKTWPDHEYHRKASAKIKFL